MTMGSKSNMMLMTDQLPTETSGLNQNIIRVTYGIIREMTEQQKFKKAKAHIMDALKYKHPRHESQSLSTPALFKYLYAIQSNSVWEWLLFLSGWIFFCFAALDSEVYATKVGVQASILIIFWIDTVILLYCKTFDHFADVNKYSKFFIFKITIFTLMTIDLIVLICLPCYDSRPIRPFRILRCFVPLLFDAQMRKSLLSLASAYKDVMVYFVFFATVIVGYAVLGNRALTFDPNFKDPNFPQNVDPYKTNFSELSRMIFMVYVTATYDSYPDNQILVIQNYMPNYIYYIVFIFANMFLFSSIPGSIIYIKFRDTRSKILLIDQIRQQHSLILAFVTLAQTQSNLSIQKLIKFLLYMYRYKIRYVEYITDICLRLDDNNNRSIQVNQFMQLTKIMLQNSAMLPPAFDDWQLWVKFRKFMNGKLNLKHIVKHWFFELVVSILIILSFINAIFFMFQYTALLETFDNIFVWIFFVELIIRIVAYGPQIFFMDRWNNVDTLLVAVGIIFFFIPNNLNADGIVRMSRIFRLASLLRLMSHSNFMRGLNFEVWHKIKNIFAIILEIMPIILKFMNLFAFFFYIYVIFGMEVFYNFYPYNMPGSPAYNQYQQVGNFKNFMNGMYVMVQILTEAGWSMIAYDHCWRAPYYYAYIMLFFCFCHITIVYIIATLIKGIFWEVFFTVNTIFEAREKSNEAQQLRQQAIDKKTKEIAEINKIINDNRFLSPNTILKRQLIQNKFDQQIFKKLINYYEHQKFGTDKSLRSKKKLVAELHKDDWQVISNKSDSKNKKKIEQTQFGGDKKPRIALNEIQEIQEQDFQTEISQIIQRLIVNPKIKYNEIIASPKIFIQYLQSKFKSPTEFISEGEFNMHFSPLYNQQSMYCHIYEMHSILGIDPSKRQQKAMIIQNLIQEQILTEQHGQNLLRKKLQEKVFNIDTNGTLRQLFLSGTNEDLIKKFEIEYFSDIYGYSYKRINKLTLQPLLRCEAAVTYTLRNVMRYPQINTTEFFEMLTHIQDRISNKLLQRGSLFKFVYKLDSDGDIWFSVEYKHQQEMKIHFIKTGLWCYHKDMKEKQVSYARDVFHWEFPVGQRQACEHYIKRFFQSFEGLAFSLLNQQKFFSADPREYVYDLYIQHFDVGKISRFQTRKLQISKIMVVILSKEEEREDIGIKKLDYNLSDIKCEHIKKKKAMDFKFDQSDNETFEKMKNLSAMQGDKIVDSEGLPFSYVINLMKEIEEIVTINASNFVYQIEKVLNEEYEEMNEEFGNHRK